MTTSVSIHPVDHGFAGEVSNVDLTQPLTPEEVAAIEAGMDRHAVLVFRDQNITDEQQISFSLHFGEIEDSAGGNVTRGSQERLDYRLNDLSNLDADHNPLARDDRRRHFNLGNHLWHSDSSYRAIPATYSLLSARVIPAEGSNTEFADMRAAWDALDDATRAEVEELICEHSLIYSRGLLGFSEFTDDELALMKPVRQSLVRTHPVSGRRSLYLSSHAGTIVGRPLAEARLFLMDLTEFATQRRFVCVHQWRQHDLVMWDNRQHMHRARPYDEIQVRDMRRTTIAGEAQTADQSGKLEGTAKRG